MSDFLTNLAARTMAAVPLRPRTRMRFEPPLDNVNDVNDGAAVTPSMDSRERPPASSTIALTDPRIPMRTASDAADEPAARVTAPEHLEPLVSRAHATPVRPSNDPPLDAGVIPAAMVVPSTPRIAVTAEKGGVEIRRDAALESQTRASEPIPDRSRAKRDPEAQPPRPHRFDIEPPDAERAASEPHTVRETVVERRLERRSPAADTRQVVGAKHRAERPLATPEPDAPEPIVHVSIGRVEIRAVPPAAPKPSSRRGAAMTIDEYAARRRERR